MRKLQLKIYNVIRDDDKNDFAGNIFDSVIITLIIINVIVVVVDTFDGLPLWYQSLSNILETVSIIIFTAEYLLRIWTAPLIYPDKSRTLARLRYIISFMAIIDLLAILPFYIPFIIPVDLRVLRALRMIRLLRLFKANRYSNAMQAIGNVLKSRASQLVSSFGIIFIVMAIASILLCNVEKEAQPDKFGNAISGLWWAVATFTTVGYGDIYPITPLGKLLSGFIAILGIGLVAVPTGIISAGFMAEVEAQKTKELSATEDKKTYCPYCGNKLE